jgi:hypothetical protein
MPEPTSDSVPMRETVKRGIGMLHAQFNRDHSEYLFAAATEADLDPNVWKPNLTTFTWERVTPLPPPKPEGAA